MTQDRFNEIHQGLRKSTNEKPGGFEKTKVEFRFKPTRNAAAAEEPSHDFPPGFKIYV